MDRRGFLIGAGCLAAAASSYAMKPRERISLMGKLKLEDAIPKAFNGWTQYESNQIVAPESENSLAKQLYSQSVGRLYVRGDEEFAMMLIAYGDTQSDTLQLHRPEVCYPAFGMEITENHPAPIQLSRSVSIPSRDLVAVNAERTEYVTYWTRLGQALPTTGSEQRAAKLKDALAGIIPDGVLVRFSTVMDGPKVSFGVNRAFAADLMAAVSPEVRRVLVGDAPTAALGRDLGGRA